jgi:hypothetical protein
MTMCNWIETNEKRDKRDKAESELEIELEAVIGSSQPAQAGKVGVSLISFMCDFPGAIGW